MRQQLITWLIEDIAPEARRIKSAKTAILKFASEHNLATAQVQALGQLYNTAKTLSFMEKSAARRGDSFPILDVDDLVNSFLEVSDKKASVTPRFEYDDQDGGCGIDLPACFAGLTHNMLRVEAPAPAVLEQNAVKRAWVEKSQSDVTLEFAKQARFDFQEEMRKAASDIVIKLRQNPGYPFQEVEADALGLFGDDVKPVMEKLAKYCADDGWPVKRAEAPSDDKLVIDDAGIMPLIESLLDNTFRVKAADEILTSSANTMPGSNVNPLTSAKLVDHDGKEIPLKAATSKSSSDVGTIDPPAIEKKKEQAQMVERPTDPGGGQQRPKGDSSGPPPGVPGQAMKSPGGGKGGGGGGGGGKGDLNTGVFDRASELLDKVMGGAAKRIAPAAISAFTGGSNDDQRTVDSGMQDARHIAVLQNLMTTDDILAEADPDQVVQIYNTIRSMSPELAGDVNVMRVLLRSAVQHEGISPFDLKGILETELAKQKVDLGQRRLDDSLYSGKSLPKDKDRD